jgi:hypothetical protein
MLERRRTPSPMLIEGIALVALCVVAVIGSLLAAEAGVPDLLRG